MAVLTLEEILKILPHRYPMLLVDRILEFDDEKRIVGLKNLTFNEPFFQGHFPGQPVMPGVLQLEAMAQVGGIMVNKIDDAVGEVAYFLSVNNAKFRKVIGPGDQMIIEINLLRARLGMAKVHGTVKVDGDIASEAELMFGRKYK